MAFSWALGTGFVNAANKRIDDNRDERRETRKLAMEVFLKDTLPRIRASQAKDDAAVQRMNTLMADSYYKGNPGLAFYATKWMNQTGQDEQAFRSHVATNEIPEELKAAQAAELNKHFNFDSNTNSFSWKNQAPVGGPAPETMAPGATGRQPSFWSKLMGSGNEAKDIQTGTSTIAKAANVDPNAPVQSRFENINVPGGIQSVDQEAKKRNETAFSMLMRDPESVKNFDAATKAYATGGAEAGLKALQFIPPEVRRDREFQDNLKKSMTSAILNNLSDMKDPTGALAALAGNRLDIKTLGDILGKGIRNPEEKAKLQAELKSKYGTPDSQLDWIALMADSDRFAQLYPDAATRQAVQTSVMQTINTMQMSSQQKIMDQVAPGMQAKNPNLGLTTAEDVRRGQQPVPADAPPVVPTPKQDDAANAAAAAAGNPLKDIEDAINSPEGLILKRKEEAPKQPTIKAPEANQEFGDIVEKGPPELIRTQPDPLRVVQSAVTRTKTGKEEAFARLPVIAKNISVAPQTLARIQEDEQYGNEWNKMMDQYVEPFLDDYESIAAAQEKVHPYGLAKVNGNIIVVPPKRQ